MLLRRDDPALPWLRQQGEPVFVMDVNPEHSPEGDVTMTLDWYFRRRYSFLLLAMVLVFVADPILHETAVGPWVYDLLITVVFVAAFLLLFKRRSYRLPAVLLGVPTLVAHWTGYALPGAPALPLALTFHLLTTLLLGLTAAAILQDIHEARAVSSDSLYGGLIGYLIIGVVFSHLYIILDYVWPGSFRGTGTLLSQLSDRNLRRSLLTYYSFATLTTIGYGDIIPATPPARSLACLEAVAGQFYMVVVMAELIGLKLSQRSGDTGPRTPGRPG